MSSQQGPPPRPWFRLATMIRPPPPPPAATPVVQPNQGFSPPRPAFTRPTFTPTTPPQTTFIQPPQQPNPNPTPSPPLPTQPTIPASNVVVPPTQPRPTSPPVPTSNVVDPPAPPLPTPLLVPTITVVEKPEPPTLPPSSLDPPTSPSRNPPQSSRPPTPPQETKTPKEIIGLLPPSLTPPRSPITTTLVVTPPSSLPKSVKQLEQTSPPPQALPISVVTPQASSPTPQPPVSSPKKSYLILSPPSSSPHPPLTRQFEHPLPPSSPPKMISLPQKDSPPSPTIQPLSQLLLPSHKHRPFNESPPEYNQKTILVQEAKEKPKNSAAGYNNRHIGGIHTHNSSRKPEIHKRQWDLEDAGKYTITISGENKGAIMNIAPFGTIKQEFGNDINIIKHNPAPSSNRETLETDSGGKKKNQNSNPLLKTSFLNSNIQGVNNSILYNCSINHHDPGIHLVISMKSDGDFGSHYKEHKKE